MPAIYTFSFNKQCNTQNVSFLNHFLKKVATMQKIWREFPDVCESGF